ncbi:hypothetical protein ABT324_28035 [Saccharopolyspora sp. NPDC000359]|uniref:hypothetical protein n=1 Tax=Saccharopolyspora sp. NPDC000359 TaxID=3154251 RepID=UPI003326F046
MMNPEATEAAVKAMSARITQVALEQVAGGRVPRADEVEHAGQEIDRVQRRDRRLVLIEMTAVLLVIAALLVLPNAF